MIVLNEFTGRATGLTSARPQPTDSMKVTESASRAKCRDMNKLPLSSVSPAVADRLKHGRIHRRLHHSLEVLKLCVSLCKVSTDDAYFVKNARAKLVDASEHQRRIDELFKQYEEVKEREAKILTDLEVRVQLAECQRSFVESLPPKSQQAASLRKVRLWPPAISLVASRLPLDPSTSRTSSLP
ncbi:hypothetical protein HPB51_016883 [Rhipicephalus microplus]|uniref:Uncharacterized protein n=1 Tax=Rhipicephalus microplus TaxID=6941 RepID=A0A9J6E321_RHIMP|nr:hypothetical protein HPB51_016883 [Rhipicephalus microplus]